MSTADCLRTEIDGPIEGEAGLSEAERGWVEREAIDSADPFLRNLFDAGGSLGETTAALLVHRHVVKLLRQGTVPPAS